MAGRKSAYMRKYAVPSLRIASSPPSQPGRGPAIDAAAIPSRNEKRVTTVRPCRSTFLAPAKSPAPMRCATCTEKPWESAMQKPLQSQVLVDTRPMDAAGAAPRLPTMAASMNSSTTEASCARMAGPQRKSVSLTLSPRERGAPLRIPSRSMSLVRAEDISQAKLRRNFLYLRYYA